MYRDIVGATRSFEAGDRAPLLRLFAENKLDTTASPVRGFSEALYLAVTCHDYPQLWDPAAPFAERRAQYERAIAAQPPERFAPISPAVWTSLDYEGALACLRWPGARGGLPPLPRLAARHRLRLAPGASYPAVPTLVLNGELDNITTTPQARQVAAQFPGATFVETRNTVHISAISDRDDCAEPLVREFIRTLRALDTSCATRIAELRALPRFPRSAADTRPATAKPGNRSSEAARRVAAAAALAVGDAIQRWVVNSGGASRGLRGGRWSYSGDKVVRFRFRRTRFVRDVAVSGTATWRLADGAVVARLRLPGRGRLRARWSTQRPAATATLAGTLRGRRVRAVMRAP